MRCAIYIRVSTKSQTDGDSLDDQLRVCRAYIERQGFREVAVFSDAGHSAFRNPERRPAYQDLLAAVKRREFDEVVVYKFDRFGRRAILQLEEAYALNELGIGLHSATESQFMNTPTGRLTFTMFAALAEFESAKTGERVCEAQRGAVLQGIWVGPVPIGYRRGSHKVLEPSEDAPIVQLAFALYATGTHSLTTVADALNQCGYTILNVQTKTRSRFTKHTVSTILRNPIYKGTIVYQGEQFPGSHTPLVSGDEWHTVQVLLSSKHGVTNHGRTLTRRLSHDDGLLTNLVACACCGAPVWYAGRSTRRHAYYRCSNRESKAVATQCAMLPMIRADVIENQMRTILSALAIPANWQEDILTTAVSIVYGRCEEKSRDAQDATTVRQRLQGRLQRILEQYEDGFLRREEYLEKAGTIKAELDNVADVIPNAATVTAHDLKQYASLLQDMPSLVATGSISEQRAVIEQLFSRVYVYRENGRGAENHRIHALVPTQAAMPMIAALYEKVRLVSRVGIEPTTL